MTLALPRAPEAAPPKGFRRVIPAWIKRGVKHRQQGRCDLCGELLGDEADTEYHHWPAIQQRVWIEEIADVWPMANDPAHISAVHKKCHGERTAKCDVPEIAKLRNRVAPAQEEHRRRMLAKVNPEDVPEPPKRKRKIPSRPFRRRRP